MDLKRNNVTPILEVPIDVNNIPSIINLDIAHNI